MSASKNFFMAGLAGLSVLFAAGISQAAEAAVKERICHLETAGATKGKIILVGSENAKNTHIAHGDPIVFQDNHDGTCEVVAERTPQNTNPDGTAR